MGATVQRLLESDLEARPHATVEDRCQYIEYATGHELGEHVVKREIHGLGFIYIKGSGFPSRGGYWTRAEPGDPEQIQER